MFPKRMFTVAEAAKLLSVHKTTILKWIAKHKIRAEREAVMKQRWMIPGEVIYEYRKLRSVTMGKNGNSCKVSEEMEKGEETAAEG